MDAWLEQRLNRNKQVYHSVLDWENSRNTLSSNQEYMRCSGVTEAKLCIVLYCIVLYIVLYCIVLYCIVLYCIVLYLRFTNQATQSILRNTRPDLFLMTGACEDCAQK